MTTIKLILAALAIGAGSLHAQTWSTRHGNTTWYSDGSYEIQHGNTTWYHPSIYPTYPTR